MAAFVQSAALTRTLGASASVCGSPVVCTKRVAPAVAAPVSTTIEAAKHAQFKAAKKSNRCRPKKHRPSDINRKPPTYNVEPLRAEGYVLGPIAHRVVCVACTLWGLWSRPTMRRCVHSRRFARPVLCRLFPVSCGVFFVGFCSLWRCMVLVF